MKKTCIKCGVEKEGTEEFFNKRSVSKDGLFNTCKACKALMYLEKKPQIREKVNEFRKNNRDLVRAQERDRYHADPDSFSRKNKEWRVANPKKVKNGKLKYYWGISIDEYERMLNEQGGVCAICGTKPSERYLAIDHNHKTDSRRGLLCMECNTGLGKFKESVETMNKAIVYLQSWNAKEPH